MTFLSLPKSFPGLTKVKPGETTEFLVTVKCPEEGDSESDSVDCEVQKVDGVPMDMGDSEDSAEGPEGPGTDAEDTSEGPESGGFSSMLMGPKKPMKDMPSKEMPAVEL